MVYRCFDESGRLLYIGYSSDLPRRARQHDAGTEWWPTVAKLRVQVFRTALEATAAERAAIENEGPAFNIQHAGRVSPAPTEALRLANGATIRALREVKGIRHGDLARRVEISPGYLSNIERGRKQPSPHVLRAIADRLGVTLDAITHVRRGLAS